MMEDKYEDMSDMEYKGVKEHEHMSVKDRSAQFAPFAALTGFDELIDDSTKKIMDQ